jgi:hypothetical protein
MLENATAAISRMTRSAVARCRRRRSRLAAGGGLSAQWSYVRILKDEKKGGVEETGGTHPANTTDHGVVLFEDGTLEVTGVESDKVKFRVTDKEGGVQDAEIGPGGSSDVWFGGGRSGVRIRVEKISRAGEG